MDIYSVLGISSLEDATDEQLEGIANLGKPKIFAKIFLNRNLAWYQEKLIELAENNAFVAAVLPRQSGKTDAAAVLAIKKFIFGKDEKILVLAPTENQAKSFLFARIEGLLKNSKFDDLCSYTTKKITKKQRGDSSFIEWVSASPTSKITGYTASFIILDESQDIEDSKLYSDIYPFAATTGATIVHIGTPRGKNHFWEIFQKKSNYVTLQNVTYKEVPRKKKGEVDKPGYVEGYVEQQKEQMPEEAFAMEYECKWVDEKDLVFDYDKIAGSVTDLTNYSSGLQNAKYYAGVDFGKSPNYTVVTLIADSNGVWNVRHWKSIQEDYTQVVKMIMDLGDEFNIAWMCVDRTGIGQAIWDMLMEGLDQKYRSRKGNDFPIEGLIFTNRLKMDMVDNVTKMMEDKKILFPEFYAEEMRAFRKKKLPQRGYSYYPEKGSHDDRVDSLLMAAYAAATQNKFSEPQQDISTISEFWGVTMVDREEEDSYTGVMDRWKRKRKFSNTQNNVSNVGLI